MAKFAQWRIDARWEEPSYTTIYGNPQAEIDWSQDYESWQPDAFDDSGLPGYDDNYNMLLLIPDTNRGLVIVAVNTIDFDWNNEQ